MLTGAELLAKVKELGNAPKSELVRSCGYVSTNKYGRERLHFTAFYEALLQAKSMDRSSSNRRDSDKLLKKIIYALSVFLAILVFRGCIDQARNSSGNLQSEVAADKLSSQRSLNAKKQIEPSPQEAKSKEDEERKRLLREEERNRRQEEEEEKRQNVPMGVSAPVKGDRVVTVTDARLHEYLKADNSLASPIAGDGGQILVVYMTIENTGKESGDMAWTLFRVEDSNGNKYSELRDGYLTLSIWRSERGLGDSDDQLFPGQVKRVAKVFRVSRNAPGMKLVAGSYKFRLY